MCWWYGHNLWGWWLDFICNPGELDNNICCAMGRECIKVSSDPLELLVHDLRQKEWEYNKDGGGGGRCQKSQYFRRIGYSRTGFVHKCCTLQRRTPIKKSQVMNFRIEIALYIASLMPVVSAVPVYVGLCRVSHCQGVALPKYEVLCMIKAVLFY